ncbi:MAG: Stk1 family PASTA domain-containing Ser/Thr kinase [Actinomycetota bacterium]|nr:Stk1 family PASTA domain-containing Ser/Thr kinase [Actinomycetota bacterium]
MVFGRRYRAIEKIGSGGMADVYKAVDDVLGRTVAVKVLHARYASDPNFVARFRQEAQAAANLSNPSIVNIYDWGNDNETYYIVMEYVRGTDLKTLVTDRGQVDPVKAAEYGAQVCAALSVAHGYDIIHRDIKPHNIVLTPDGQVKVMDFGIARAGNSNMTQTGSVLGTAHYVSPEQAQGRKLGPASDLYSLGVVLYELTTGRVPFEADSPVAVALKQVNEDPTPPREINPNIPPSMEAVILRAMAKSPSERYASAEEMRHDLMRVASGRMVEAPVRAGDETSVMPAVERAERLGETRVRPVPRRRPWWPWAAAVAALVIIGLIAAYVAGLIGGPSGIVVPDLTGMTEEQAAEALTAVELTLGEVTPKFSEEPAGTVISQSPEPETKVEKDSSVNVVVSKGRELFEIPDLTGMTESNAIKELKSAGFVLENIKREFNTEEPADTVFDQTPAAGEMHPAGMTILLFVSKGTELKKVPTVTGMKTSDAKAALEAEGFKVKVNEEYSETIAKGRVIRQTPEGGVSIDAGETVTITVSKGTDMIPVPEIIGKTEHEAKKMLKDAGFDALVNYQISPDDGLVLTSDPIPGATAKRGSTVTIWVGQAPVPGP